ncbi:dermonecrotic toxin domain-containing protein [Pseudomonas putida]|uniref:dermonecrotic toxin domain-containing protein n=1 Tax=Pseudomonas putida TaxID=303 RepID=UPI002366EF96|nr:DUF6543 domain-containing protein [Pseudomonas putida]MDD2048062.1 hypothetical protein [Pseudomonas putida]
MSSSKTNLPAPDFKQAVALQFAGRPTLRQVAAQKILQLLVERFPILGTVKPSLPDAEPLRLLLPQARSSSSQPLVEVVLQAVLDGQALNLERAHDRDPGLTFVAPYRFEGSDGFEFIAFNGMTDAINHLVSELPFHFQQAQVDYWNDQSSSGVSRDRWLQQMLKLALLRNLPWQNLDPQQEQCVRGLLEGGSNSPSVFTVEVELEVDDERFLHILPNLLVSGEWDERTVVLWCSPSSVVRSFDSLDNFALALRNELADRYRFDSISWNRYELEGDVFAQQAALLLEVMLDSVQRLRYSRLTDIAHMEQAFAALSDPSQWFIEGYTVHSDAAIKLPPGIWQISPEDSFAYQCAVFELTLAQAKSQGAAALDDVSDLHSYASQRLREQLLADHPLDANYFPDDLNLTLTVARGIPGGAGAGVGGGLVETRTTTLTQFAIGNLSSLQGATLTAIEHREGQLIMPWMTLDYVKSLVEQVDIGAHYPSYVAQKLDDPDTREQRVTCFAREWRCSLLFSALRSKLGGTLSEAGLQCVADYCRGDIDPDLPAITLMPLAFKREPTASESDLVCGMYVLFSASPALVLLYRPLYTSAPLTEFVSLQAMMAAIRQEGALQDSILDWLLPQARSVYDHGGFSEPHLGRPIFDTSLLPESVQPASLATQFWRIDVDAKLYKANRDLLLELADRQSVSNAESRWAILVEGAWLLFDVVTLLLRGPVATVAWLVQAIQGLKNDVSALTQGNAFERSAAVVDLLLNFAMALFHARLPRREVPVADHLIEASAFDDPAPQRPGFVTVNPALEQGLVGMPGTLGERSALQLDFAWRGRQGLNVLAPTQREALLAMRSAVSLNGFEPLDSGSGQGLYQIDDGHYAALAGNTYAVELSVDGVRVVDAQGNPGPWLTFEHGVWRVDAALRLRGGMPKSRRQIQEEANRRQLDQDRERETALTRKHNVLALQVNKLKAFLSAKDAQIEAFENDADLDDLKLVELTGLKSVRKLTNQKVVYALKPLIENGLEHDKVLSSIEKMTKLEPMLGKVVVEQRSTTRQELIGSCTEYHDELAKIINEEDLEKLADTLVVRPETETEIKQYRDFLATLEKVVGWETDLVELSCKLDDLLEDTLKNNSMVFKDATGTKTNKNRVVGDIVERRRETAIDLEVRLLFDLAELSLDRLAQVDASVLEQYHNYLAGDGIKSAGAAHGDLAGSGLAQVEQIEVLNGIVEAYEEALVLVDYLNALGGAAIRMDKLKLYKAALTGLKRAAISELSQAVRENELGVSHLSRPVLYAARGGRRRLARTHQGRSVLAEELEVDGVSVIQQRESRTGKVLKKFHRQGSELVEDVRNPADEMPPTSPKHPDVDRKRARVLLTEVDAVIRLAYTYSPDEPLGLSSVIEGHVEKLNKALVTLPRIASDEELIEDLDSNIRRLSNARRDMLTSLYLNTQHPTANSLRYLYQERRITIEPTVRRKALSSNDYLDIYEIRRLAEPGQQKGDGLWEAHFHYPSAETPARQFSRGHLKVWWQRKLGRKAQLSAAASGQELLEVYRSELRLKDVDDIIPFP